MSGHHIVNSYFASANGRVAASQGLYSGSGSARNAGIWEEEKSLRIKNAFERSAGQTPLRRCVFKEKKDIGTV